MFPPYTVLLRYSGSRRRYGRLPARFGARFATPPTDPGTPITNALGPLNTSTRSTKCMLDISPYNPNSPLSARPEVWDTWNPRIRNGLVAGEAFDEKDERTD